ncbi:hypothetical protein ACFE04_029515 [Oxalis oulophora]
MQSAHRAISDVVPDVDQLAHQVPIHLPFPHVYISGKDSETGDKVEPITHVISNLPNDATEFLAFLAAAASVPSFLVNKPVKITLDRDVDMMITGQRHSFLGKYKISVGRFSMSCVMTSYVHGLSGRYMTKNLTMFTCSYKWIIVRSKIYGQKLNVIVITADKKTRKLILYMRLNELKLEAEISSYK